MRHENKGEIAVFRARPLSPAAEKRKNPELGNLKVSNYIFANARNKTAGCACVCVRVLLFRVRGVIFRK